MSDQKRRFPRQPVSIDCQVEGSSGRASMRVSELSLGGCYVDTRMEFTPGTPVTIRAAFPGGESVLTGRVIYMQAGYGFGVAFDELPAETRQMIEGIVPTAAG